MSELQKWLFFIEHLAEIQDADHLDDVLEILKVNFKGCLNDKDTFLFEKRGFKPLTVEITYVPWNSENIRLINASCDNFDALFASIENKMRILIEEDAHVN